ncbi:MAG TPA: photosystem I reaction center subunit PsaK [Coleofasciculaceae cyanobacterium]
MYTSALLAVVPNTPSWSPTVGFIMIACNILAIAIGRATIQKPNEGTGLSSSNLLGGLSSGALLGSAAFGHVIGTGVILGLSNLGVI